MKRFTFNGSAAVRAPLRLPMLALLLTFGAWLAAPAQSRVQTPTAKPALMLANVYHPGVALADYWVSEKYDGVRGFWDGEKLLTRGGEHVMAPAWFTAGWPAMPMDGELWAGRGQFPKAVSTVRTQKAGPGTDADWRGMRFMVFDLPTQTGPFTNRIPALNALVAQINKPWVVAVAQYRVADHAALQMQLKKTVRLGGEGLMLHRGDALYKGLRNDDLLKVKTHEDAEARVVGHLPGKGKNAGRLGALLVEMPAAADKPAQRFRLGTGFSDAQRDNPPALGALVTYRFRGVNESGIPRFASFMRVREDGPN
ncbi:MAG: DNA ligase [Pseudomonadota bacterium]